MAITISTTDVKNIFKNLGKLVYIANKAPTDATAYRIGAMAAVDQAVSGIEADYTVFHSVMKPHAENIGTVVSTLEKLPATVKASVETYLKKCVLPALITAGVTGLTTSSTTVQIVAGLSGAMAAAAPTPQSVGPASSVTDGFSAYMYANFGAYLAENVSPQIGDATYISANVQA